MIAWYWLIPAVVAGFVLAYVPDVVEYLRGDGLGPGSPG